MPSPERAALVAELTASFAAFADCPECGGTGWFSPTPVHRDGWVCVTCKGTGRVHRAEIPAPDGAQEERDDLADWLDALVLSEDAYAKRMDEEFAETGDEAAFKNAIAAIDNRLKYERIAALLRGEP